MQIPADMVVNSMVVAMAANANQVSDNVVIYQMGSSVSNPIGFKSIQDYGQLYFKKHPWIGKDGKAVKVGNIKWLSSMASFRRYMTIRYLLPLKVRGLFFYFLFCYFSICSQFFFV